MAALQNRSAKRSPRNSVRGLEIKRAEGKGVEPSTGCPAPDFELVCALFHDRPPASISYTVAYFGRGVVSTTVRRARHSPPLWLQSGYKTARCIRRNKGDFPIFMRSHIRLGSARLHLPMEKRSFGWSLPAQQVVYFPTEIPKILS